MNIGSNRSFQKIKWQSRDVIAGKVSDGDRSPIPLQPRSAGYRASHLEARPLAEMRPTLPRTQESYSRVLEAFASAADEFLR